jgi:hypothetical protein
MSAKIPLLHSPGKNAGEMQVPGTAAASTATHGTKIDDAIHFGMTEPGADSHFVGNLASRYL